MGLLRSNSVSDELGTDSDGCVVPQDDSIHVQMKRSTSVMSQQNSQPEEQSTSVMSQQNSALEDQDYYKCGLCNSSPQDGRLLDCFHTFCERCLDDDYGKVEFLTCPLCQRTTDIPEEGIGSLPRNAYFPSSTEKQIRVAPSCDLCDNSRHAEMYCKMCDQNMCQSCHSVHLRSNASRSHDVNPIDLNVIPVPDDITIDKSQNQEITCDLHNEPMTYHCRMCASAICKLCRKDPIHKGHRTKPLSVVMDTKKTRLLEKIQSIENGHFEVVKKKLYNTRRHADVLKDNSHEVINQIIIRAEDLKHAIEIVCDSVIAEVIEKERCGLEKCEQLEKILEKEALAMGNLLKYANSLLKFGNDLQVLEALPRMDNVLDDYGPGKETPRLEKTDITFEVGELTPETLRCGFGTVSTRQRGRSWSRSILCGTNSVQDVGIRIESSFDCPLSPIEEEDDQVFPVHAMAPSDTLNRVWTCAGWNSSSINLIDSTGVPQSSAYIGHNVDDIAVGIDGTVYVSCFYEKSILRYDHPSSETDVMSLPFYPRGIATTADGGFLVCMVDNYSSCVSEDNKRFVAKYTCNLTLENTFEYYDNKRLFTRPYRITENINGDICITDKTSMGSGRVVVLDRNGKCKFIYEGPTNNQCADNFSPSGITCDSYGRLLIADTNNNCIHILDPNGNFIGFLMKQDDNDVSPHAIVFDNYGQLWVGDEGGTIKLFEYV